MYPMYPRLPCGTFDDVCLWWSLELAGLQTKDCVEIAQAVSRVECYSYPETEVRALLHIQRLDVAGDPTGVAEVDQSRSPVHVDD